MNTIERFRLPVAVNLLLIRDNSLLLLRRFQTGFMDGCYCPIAGCIEGDESVSSAMIREAEEEAGIFIAKKDLEPAAVIHRHSTDDAWESISFFFLAENFEGTPYNREPHKCDDMRFFPLDSLPENVPPYIRAGIKASLGKKFFIEWGF